MAADRAINMALRVLGIGEVERDFRRVGEAGSKSFAQVQKSANGAAQEVSEYTARLRRTVVEAKHLADQIPDLNKGTATSRINRAAFVKGAVGGEQDRIFRGLPEATRGFDAAAAASGRFGLSLGQVTALGAAAGTAIAGVTLFAKESLTAFEDHEKALASFRANLALAGNRSEATGEQIEGMARRVKDSTGQSEAAALKGAQALAAVSNLTASAMEQALDAAARFADATGQELPEVIERRAVPVLKALAERDLKAVWAASEGLSDALRVTIQQLAEAGKTAEAQQALFAGLAAAAGKGPGGLTVASDELSDAWADLKTSFGEDISSPAATAMSWLAGKLRELRGEIDATQFSWGQLFKDAAATVWSPIGATAARGDRPFGREAKSSAQRYSLDDIARQTSERDAAAKSGPWWVGTAAQAAAFEAKYGKDSKSTTTQSRSSAQVLADFKAELRRQGVTVISDVRSAAKQNALFRHGLTPLDGYDRISRHQSSQAVDVDPRSHSDAKAHAAAQAAGLKGFEIVTESGGRKHYEWTGAGKPGEVDVAGSERRAEKQARDAELRDRDAKSAQDEAIRRQRDFDNQMATLDGQLLDARRSSLVDISQIAEFERQQVQNEAERTRIGIDAREKLGDYTKAQADAAREKVAQVAAERSARISAEERDAKAREDLASLTAANDNQRDLLGAQESLALTVAERRSLALSLLELDRREETARLKAVIAAESSTAQQRADAQARLNALPGIYGARAEGVKQGTLGPLEAYIRGTDPATIHDRVEQLTVNELQAVREGINSAVSSALGVRDPMLAGLIDLFIEQVLIRPIAQALQAHSGGGGMGGGLGGIGSLIGGLFGGGGVGSGGAGAVPLWGGGSFINPSALGGFAGGTERVPVGRPFYVGESGRELMEMTRGGSLRVISGEKTRRFASEGGSAPVIHQTINVPQGADPRRTMSQVARGTQQGMARAARKRIAGI